MLLTLRTLKTTLSVCLLGLSALPANAEQRPFDYYLMSLSWSPEFCATRPEDRQCGRGYGIVLHGVWPQYRNGYPENCSTERMNARTLRSYQGLYPSEKLAYHEWKKHGTCSGLSPNDYLQLSQNLKQRFIAPKALEDLTQPMRTDSQQLNSLILASNPGLNADALAFTCKDGGRFLQEILVCFTADGAQATACGTDVKRRSAKSCGQDSFLIRNIR